MFYCKIISHGFKQCFQLIPLLIRIVINSTVQSFEKSYPHNGEPVNYHS